MTAITIRESALDDHLISFGPEQHPARNAVMTVFGCNAEQARAIAHALYGPNWCGIYSGPEMNRYLSKYDPVVVLTVQISGPDAA